MKRLVQATQESLLSPGVDLFIKELCSVLLDPRIGTALSGVTVLFSNPLSGYLYWLVTSLSLVDIDT